MKKRMNKSELARALDLSLTSLKRHLGRPDAPRPDKRGLYDRSAVEAYIAGRRRLNNDSATGDQTGDILRLRCQKLELEIEGLRRDLAIAGDRISLGELAPFISDLLFRMKLQLPSGTRPELVVALCARACPGADPLKVLEVCKSWARGVEDYLLRWLANNGLQVTVGGGKTPVDLRAAIKTAFSDRLEFPKAQTPLPAADVADMFQEFVEALRLAGVSETQLQQAGAMVGAR